MAVKDAIVTALLLTVALVAAEDKSSWDYSSILSSARDDGLQFSDLPGFTRSVVNRDHALITPESRVWAAMPGWKHALTAHLISPASSPSTNFVMYLAKLAAGGTTAPAPPGHERFVFVLDGGVNVTGRGKAAGQTLHANDYVYHPPGDVQGLSSDHGAGLLIYERKYMLDGKPVTQFGHTDDVSTLETPGEVFVLRKLLPATTDYDFNIHVMDFNPGEFLNVKEIHYNQHGLLLLQGQGIYRLGQEWYPVQAGDAIWMAPYVPQWYCALGSQVSRYIIIKDTIVDPLHG